VQKRGVASLLSILCYIDATYCADAMLDIFHYAMMLPCQAPCRHTECYVKAILLWPCCQPLIDAFAPYCH